MKTELKGKYILQYNNTMVASLQKLVYLDLQCHNYYLESNSLYIMKTVTKL